MRMLLRLVLVVLTIGALVDLAATMRILERNGRVKKMVAAGQFPVCGPH